MPRIARTVLPGRPHHIVLRGNNRRRLFSFARDYLRLLAFISVALEPGRCALHSIVMMTNHIHLVLTPREVEDLALFVKSFAQRYAQYRNRLRGGSGKLFEQRFYSRPIEDDNHYGCTLAYVDDNPRRAGIVEHPADYRWSSYHFYVRGGEADWGRPLSEIITPAAWFLELARTDAARRARYAEWVEDCHARSSGPLHVGEIDAIERVSQPCSKRLLRPDGTSAA